MAKRSFWQRVRDAFRTFTTEPEEPSDVITQEDIPSEGFLSPNRILVYNGYNEPWVDISGDIPGLSYENDYGDSDSQEDRRRLVRLVMEWFKGGWRDGERVDMYWDVGMGRYVNDYGPMRSPARLKTVVEKISEFTDIEVEFGLQMTRADWQDMAHATQSYWYH